MKFSAHNPNDTDLHQVSLKKECATKVKVEIFGSSSGLKGIKISGTAYSSKEIIRLRVGDQFKNSHWYINRDLEQSLENMAYED